MAGCSDDHIHYYSSSILAAVVVQSALYINIDRIRYWWHIMDTEAAPQKTNKRDGTTAKDTIGKGKDIP